MPPSAGAVAGQAGDDDVEDGDLVVLWLEES